MYFGLYFIFQRKNENKNNIYILHYLQYLNKKLKAKLLKSLKISISYGILNGSQKFEAVFSNIYANFLSLKTNFNNFVVNRFLKNQLISL